MITSSVLIGNLLTLFAVALYFRAAAHEVVTNPAALSSVYMQELTAVQEQLRRLQEQSQARAEKRERESRRQREIQTQLKATCEYWRAQVRQLNTSQNRAFRDAACSKVP